MGYDTLSQSDYMIFELIHLKNEMMKQPDLWALIEIHERLKLI